MDNKHKSVRMENTSPCRENRRVVCIFGFAHNRKFQFAGLLIDRRHLVLYVLVVSENILKKIKIIYISHLN